MGRRGRDSIIIQWRTWTWWRKEGVRVSFDSFITRGESTELAEIVTLTGKAYVEALLVRVLRDVLKAPGAAGRQVNYRGGRRFRPGAGAVKPI